MHRLSNGTRVIIAPNPHTPLASIMIAFGTGARDEIKAGGYEHGISHFAEHMMFRGTRHRPNKRAIVGWFDANGAKYNASTSHENTIYYATCVASGLDMAAGILTDMVQNSLFRPEDVEAESGVIVQEARMYFDSPEDHVPDVAQRAMYGDSPLGDDIVGTEASIRGITSEKLATYRAAHYVPRNTVIAVTGNVNEAAMLAFLEQCYGGISDTGIGSESYLPAKPPGEPTIIMEARPDLTQAHVMMGFLGYKHGHPRWPALKVLSTILGGNMSSRLFDAVRERGNLAYHVASVPESYRDTGELCVVAGLDADKLERAIEVIVRELVEVKTNGVTAAELEAAKGCLNNRLLMAVQDPGTLAVRLALSTLNLGSPKPVEAQIAEVDAVEGGDVLEVARELLTTPRFRLAVVSEFDDPSPYHALAERLGE
ncbi:MAG: pitrilysin family protein [Patescibacteria group bacterium]|nr:pitrilysin family protein [Patescibacteria group bacterium]